MPADDAHIELVRELDSLSDNHRRALLYQLAGDHVDAIREAMARLREVIDADPALGEAYNSGG